MSEWFRRLAPVTVVSLFFALIGINGALAENYPKEFRIGVGKDGLLVMVRQQGMLEKRLAEHGVTVQWIEFASGTPLIEAMNAGSLDYGYVGDAPPIFGQAAGVDLVYTAATPSEGNSTAILVKNDSPIKTIADLKGKRIGFTKGTSAQFFILMTAAKAGFTMDDIKPVYLTPPDGAAAFASGQIDAWVIWDALYAIAEAKEGARTLTTAKGIVPANLFFIADRKFADAYPGALQQTYAVLDQTNEWIKQHKDETTATFSKNTGVPLEIQKVITERTTFALTPMTDTIGEQQQLAADKFGSLGLLPKPVKVRDAVWVAPRS
jgi:sulfonate transport system substrate-binding protein